MLLFDAIVLSEYLKCMLVGTHVVVCVTTLELLLVGNHTHFSAIRE